MKKLFAAALLGSALLAGPVLAQSGGTGGLSGGSPGSPGVGGRAGTSTPNMGSAATQGVEPGMREGAPLSRQDTRRKKASRRNAGDPTNSGAAVRNDRKRSGG